MPKISIIIPCHNSERFIKETLNSVLMQSFLDWECILVNDGSTDNTIEVLNQYSKVDTRFKIIDSSKSGVSIARNIGIGYSKGDFIQLLDSDDILGPGKLLFQEQYLEKNPDVDIVYTGARYFSDSTDNFFLMGRNNLFPTIEISRYDNDLEKIFSLRNPFVTPAPLYRKRVFDIVGDFDPSFDYCEDWDFQIRCAQKGFTFQHVPFSPEIGSFIRLRENSLMSHRPNVQKSKILLYEKYPDLFKGVLEINRNNYSRRLKEAFKWLLGI